MFVRNVQQLYDSKRDYFQFLLRGVMQKMRLNFIKPLLGAFIFSLGVMVSSSVSMAQPAGFSDPGSRAGGGGGGDFIPVESVVDGGTITVGATAQVVVLFRNDSGRPIQTGAIQLYP
jgi:hypothetical protein